jgi:hypothetical protein
MGRSDVSPPGYGLVHGEREIGEIMDIVEIIVGVLLAGGLLVLVSRGGMRLFRGPDPGSAVAPPRPPAPAPGPPTTAPLPTPPAARVILGETEQEAGALVDGLIIGHHLTRTHYEDRLEDQAETIDALRADVAAAWYPGDDADPDDDAEDDGSGGFGSGGAFGQGVQVPDLDPDLDPELAEFDAAGDPWEDDVFGFDEDDDD